MSVKMVPFESFGMVFYSHSTATMAVSLAVSTQYTNVTASQQDRQTHHTTAKDRAEKAGGRLSLEMLKKML